MTKEHKKMYKAGKNWIVATLTATTITLLGGIGACTVHADTTIESSQDVQTTSVNQTNQVDNSNDSVTINQPAAVQSSQTAQNDQSVQGNQTNQTVPSSATAAATNNSDGLDSNIYGTVNVKDWDYQINNNILNLTKYHGEGNFSAHYGYRYHIVIPNLNDFNNANINISGIKSVGITSNVLKDWANAFTIAISKTQGVYDDKVVAENSNWASTFKRDHNEVLALEYADLTNLDTSKITNVESLFDGQSSLKEVKGLDSWDTSKVTNMRSMFAGTQSLKTVGDLSNWDTSNVTDMSGMFCDTALTSIGSLNNWNTSKVTNMSFMFTDIGAKTVGDLSNWDTSKVTNMSDMFSESALQMVGDLSNWDTSKVTNMSGMFQYSRLHILNLGNWNTSNVTDMSYMFQNSYLNEVGNLSNWDTSKLTYPAYMFDGSGIDYFLVTNEKGEFNNQIKIMDNLAVMGQTGRTIATIKVPTFYKDTSGKSKAQIVYDTVLPLVKKTADEQYKIFYDSLDTDIKKNFPSDILLKRVHPANISNSSEVANSIFEIMLPGIQINYVDQNGKVVETAQISGKVGDKVDVKILLPDGYELANKDEQVSYTITDGDDGIVGDDGIKTIIINIKKIPITKTGTINYIDPDGKVVKTDQVSGKVGDKVDVKLSLPDGYELANKDEQVPSTITVGDDGIKTIIINIKKIPVTKTGTINYIDPDGKVVKTDQVSGKVGDKVDVKL